MKSKERVLQLYPLAVAVRYEGEPTWWVIRPHSETLEAIGEAAHRESWAWADARRNISQRSDNR